MDLVYSKYDKNEGIFYFNTSKLGDWHFKFINEKYMETK